MLKRGFSCFRALLFYIGYFATLIPHACLCVILVIFLPMRVRYRYVLIWNKFAIWWLKITCGVSYRISGRENVPPGSFVLLSNHQSPWETIFLYAFFQPLTATIKRELLFIPFFGWGLSLLYPIAIDRSKIRQALQTLLTQGKSRLEDGISVLVFPEGTRVEPGTVKKYSTGGAALAIESHATLLPVAHNAGLFWPAHKFIKIPGTIQVVIGEPIDTAGRSPRELSEQVEAWIRNAI